MVAAKVEERVVWSDDLKGFQSADCLVKMTVESWVDSMVEPSVVLKVGH